MNHDRTQWIVVSLLVLLVSLISVNLHFTVSVNKTLNKSDSIEEVYEYGDLEYHPASRILSLSNLEQTSTIKMKLGLEIERPSKEIKQCQDGSDGGLCFDYDGTTLSINQSLDAEDCYDIEWEATEKSAILTDCVDVKNNGQHVFGGASNWYEYWPKTNPEQGQSDFDPFVSEDIFQGHNYDPPKYFPGSIMDRYFLFASGHTIQLAEEIPFFMSYKSREYDDNFCIQSKNQKPFVKDRKSTNLKYRVCSGRHIRDIHEKTTDRIWQKPNSFPELEIFQKPIWSTWAEYKGAVDENDVLGYAEKILENHFLISQLELDDRWSTTYGEMEFDPEKFKNAKSMVKQLSEMGIPLTIWSHPFVNVETPTYQSMYCKFAPFSPDERYDGCHRDVAKYGATPDANFLKVLGGGSENDDDSAYIKHPALTEWWRGYAAHIDPVAGKEFFVARHEQLKTEYGITSFKFDAGETHWIPQGALVNGKLYENPCQITNDYVDMLGNSSLNDRRIEVRAVYRNQNQGIFVRMMDKDSNWGYSNGLRTMIPSLLFQGILGYPYVLPDMIGGNNYGQTRSGGELYIRWCELTAFMPAMQFSIAPWSFQDDQITSITKFFINLHAEFVYPLMEDLIKSKGTLINRPLWWINPRDENTHLIDDQFTIGDDYIVAPILDENTTARLAYFPNSFVDENDKSQEIIWHRIDLKTRKPDGGQGFVGWHEIQVPIDDVGLFVKSTVESQRKTSL